MAQVTNKQIAEYTGVSLETVRKVSKMAYRAGRQWWAIGKSGDGFMGVEFPEFQASYKYKVVIDYINAHCK